MSRLVLVYKCKHCGRSLVNHTETQINAHLISEHGKAKRFVARLEKKKKKQKHSKGKIFKKILHANDLQNTLNQVKKENSNLRTQIAGLRSNRSKREPHPFYDGLPWRKLRIMAYKKYPRICMLCRAENTVLHVDHIKPRSKFPELELDLNNLQILCEACNLGKGAWDETDWRPQQ